VTSAAAADGAADDVAAEDGLERAATDAAASLLHVCSGTEKDGEASTCCSSMRQLWSISHSAASQGFFGAMAAQKGAANNSL
jgi:hypothetical protein